jgi:glycosyltransferase involved in cell wall biosynthesis
MNQPQASAGKIAYLLKGFGRTSETFISNEIFLLQQSSITPVIYSLLRLEAQQPHAVVGQIESPIHYLPSLTSLSETSLWPWLRENAPAFRAAHKSVFLAKPLAYLRTLMQALSLALTLREAQFIREFLQAGWIAHSLLAEGSVRHLHAHFAHTATTVTMFAAKLAGLPFSFTAHAKDIYLRELNPGGLLPLKLRRAAFVVTCTQFNERHLRQLEPRTAPLHTIYHGVNARKFVRRTAAQPISDKPLVLAVGRFVEKKGFPDLIQACAILQSQGCEFTCQIIGDGAAHRDEITALIAQLQLSDVVTLHAAMTQEALQEKYEQAAVFVLPCRIADNGDRDGIPNVLAEAMAMELPVVASAVSGIPELIENRMSGLLTPPENPAALAAAIAELLRDESLRHHLGQNARQRVMEMFDADSNVKRLVQLFQACLK